MPEQQVAIFNIASQGILMPPSMWD